MARRSVSGPSPLRRIATVLTAAAGLAGVLYGFAWLLRPDLTKGPPAYPPRVLDEAKTLRDNALDVATPLRLQQDVDYAAGTNAAWYPKGESPILAELVREGKLPPVAERVGPEPCVLRGCDGVGTYGGTWVRLNGLLLENRMSYTTLVRFSPHGFPIVPHLAKSWEVNADSTRWTFHLRRGVKWSDGAPFTARDILFWWRHEQNCAQLVGEVLNILKVNGKTGDVLVDTNEPYRVVFVFPEPNGMFLTRLATGGAQWLVHTPEHYLRPYHPELGDATLIEAVMKKARLPNRAAVYRYMKSDENTSRPHLRPWMARSYVSSPPHTAVRNPYYWVVDEAGNQLPYIDRIFSESVSPDLVPVKAASGGVTCQARFINYDDYTYLMEQRSAGGYQIYHWLAGERPSFVITFNLNRRTSPDHPDWALKRALMNDIRFRQALSLAIDRSAVIRAECHGQTEPAQAAPGRNSPFFNEHAFHAFTEYAPDRANRLLDEVGLTRHDAEGYRTFQDGTRMVFYMDYVKGFTSDRSVQFVIDDWATVGIRTIPRQRQRRLWSVEHAALMHDFTIGGGGADYHPLAVQGAVPGGGSAPAYAEWYLRGGLDGNPNAAGGRTEPIPEGHPMRAAIAAYIDACRPSDLKEQQRAFDPAWEIVATNVWSIGLSTAPPALLVVKNGLRNVPRTAIYSWGFQSPGNAGIETFYFDKPLDSPATVAVIKAEIEHVVPRPGDLAAADRSLSNGVGPAPPRQVKSASGKAVTVLLRVLIWGAALLAVVLVGLRHAFVFRRLLIMVPTLFIISVVVFVVIQAPPGDFLTSRVMDLQQSGDELDLQELRNIEQQFHLNSPMIERYARWLGVYWFAGFSREDSGLLQGNLGRSMENSREVNDLIGDRLLLTFLISLGTILFTWFTAIPLGVYSAVRQYSFGDYVVTIGAFLGMCIPGFLLALLLMYAAQTLFGISAVGLFSPEYATQAEWTTGKVLDLLKHIWVPVIVLGVGGTAGMIRVMRANLLDELKKPYVVTARAKGVRPLKLLIKYPVRLALNPFISGIGHIFPELISGGAIVSIVLSLPTVGPLMLSGLMNEDFYLAGSMLMVLSLLGVLGTLVSDLLLLALDPRIRHGGGGR